MHAVLNCWARLVLLQEIADEARKSIRLEGNMMKKLMQGLKDLP